MKWTNRYNLPENVENAVVKSNNLYSKGAADRSVTQIIEHPRIDQLKKKYRDELTTDVSESFWALLGSGVHYILELGKLDNQIAEERLFAEIDGWVLSGALDLQTFHPDDTHVHPGKDFVDISDYKVTSSYSVTKDTDGPKWEWVAQMNLQALLVEMNKPVVVRSLEIIAIIRDWSRRKAELDIHYPVAPVVKIPIPLWSFQDRMAYATERVNVHRTAEMDADLGLELPECSAEDRWENNTKYAIKRSGLKRAVKLCSSRDEAEAEMAVLLEDNPKKHKFEIEVRLGESTRCKSFCPVSQWCSQWQRMNTTTEDTSS